MLTYCFLKLQSLLNHLAAENLIQALNLELNFESLHLSGLE